jgi:hypothetical protein
MIVYWVAVKGRNFDRDVELFYVVEADTEDKAIQLAASRLGFLTLDEVYEVEAVRSA